tara:strand:+ start:9348 stop:9518 length:171 start_codon:yes stop_codon:yes gene_type:complete
MTGPHAAQIRDRLMALYPAKVAERFDIGLARDQRRRRVPPPALKRILARIARKLRV